MSELHVLAYEISSSATAVVRLPHPIPALMDAVAADDMPAPTLPVPLATASTKARVSDPLADLEAELVADELAAALSQVRTKAGALVLQIVATTRDDGAVTVGLNGEQLTMLSAWANSMYVTYRVADGSAMTIGEQQSAFAEADLAELTGQVEPQHDDSMQTSLTCLLLELLAGDLAMVELELRNAN